MIKTAAIVMALGSQRVLASAAKAGRSECQSGSLHAGNTRACADAICDVFGASDASCGAAPGGAMAAHIHGRTSCEVMRDWAGRREETGSG
jgi:hypothetical protein